MGYVHLSRAHLTHSLYFAFQRKVVAVVLVEVLVCVGMFPVYRG